MTDRLIVGLIGRARAGKDSVAARLVAEHGFRRYAFADLLRTAVLELDPYIAPTAPAWASTRLSELVSGAGWDVAKRFPETRRVLQTFGVAIRRIAPDFWLRPVMDAIDDAPDGEPAVISDVRFRNEAGAVLDAGGVLVRVTRPGLAATDNHVSETELSDWPVTHTIVNDGDLPALSASVDRLMEALTETLP